MTSSGNSSNANTGCGCLFLIGIVIAVAGGIWWFTSGSGAPEEWKQVACSSYSDVLATSEHWQAVSEAVTADDSARLATELDAIEGLVRPVVDRIGNLGAEWEKGDMWLTELQAVADDYRVTAEYLREGNGDSAVSALAAGVEQFRSVVSQYADLGLECSGLE